VGDPGRDRGGGGGGDRGPFATAAAVSTDPPGVGRGAADPFLFRARTPRAPRTLLVSKYRSMLYVEQSGRFHLLGPRRGSPGFPLTVGGRSLHAPPPPRPSAALARYESAKPCANPSSIANESFSAICA
jgi:hypothetical protein